MMDAPQRIAIYGGSFNPPHVGHVLTATLALCTGRFDEIRIIPVADHAFGKELTPLDLRVDLTRLAVAHLGPRVVVDPIEARLPAPSYTVNTVAQLLAEDPNREITLILGADTWLERRRWHQWDRLERLIGGRIVVFGRSGVSTPADAPIEFVLPDIASSEIRRRRKAGEPFWWMVPEAVETAILDKELYL